MGSESEAERNPGESETQAGAAPRGDPIDVSDDEDSDSTILQLEEHWLFCGCSNGAYPCEHMGYYRMATHESFCCVCGRPLCAQCSWEAHSPPGQQLHECCSCRWEGRHDKMEADAADNEYWPLALERGACSDEPEAEASSGSDT